MIALELAGILIFRWDLFCQGRGGIANIQVGVAVEGGGYFF